MEPSKKKIWFNFFQNFDLNITSPNDMIDFGIFDKTMTSNSEVRFAFSDIQIGGVRIICSQLANNGGCDMWHEVTHKGKSAGQIHIKTAYYPHQGGQPAIGGMAVGMGVQ